jgi:hypothetical protein
MFILQYVYVTYTYHHTGQYYSISMRHVINTVQVHITACLFDVQISPIQFHFTCDLQVSQYRFILQYTYGTYNYHQRG